MFSWNIAKELKRSREENSQRINSQCFEIIVHIFKRILTCLPNLKEGGGRKWRKGEETFIVCTPLGWRHLAEITSKSPNPLEHYKSGYFVCTRKLTQMVFIIQRVVHILFFLLIMCIVYVLYLTQKWEISLCNQFWDVGIIYNDLSVAKRNITQCSHYFIKLLWGWI